MTRRPHAAVAALFLGTVLAASAQAQSSIRNMLIVDSLSPVKMQLRDDVAQLRDTLNLVEAIHARIVRANASGMTAVARSGGHQLRRACRQGEVMIDTTQHRVSVMVTSDVRGEQALASFRAGLITLSDNMRLCQLNDSTVMAAKAPDLQRLQQVAASARDAIAEYDLIRDGLLKLLDITLPVKGYVPIPRH